MSFEEWESGPGQACGSSASRMKIATLTGTCSHDVSDYLANLGARQENIVLELLMKNATVLRHGPPISKGAFS